MKKNYILLFTVALLISFQLFSQNQRIDSLHIYTWSNGTNDWDHTTTEKLTFGNGGDKETHLLRTMKIGGVWTNFYQDNKTYDANDNLSLNIHQNWNSTNSLWKDNGKYEYTYNADENVTVYLYSLFYDNFFNENEKETNTYGADGITEKLILKIDYTSATLINNKKDTYTYQNSKVVLITREVWDVPSSSWIHHNKKAFVYNGDFVTEESTTLYDAANNVWENHFFNKVTYTYDANNIETSTLSESWSVTDNQLNNYQQTTSTYTNDNLTEHILQSWNNTDAVWRNLYRNTKTYDANNEVTQWVIEEWENNAWKGNLKYTYFLSNARGLSVRFEEQNSFSVFPNPVKDVLHFSFTNPLQEKTSIKIFNISGKKIFDKELVKNANSSSISLKNYSKGLYFIKIQNTNKTQQFKIVKE